MWYRNDRWKPRLAAEVDVMCNRFPGFSLIEDASGQLLWVGVLEPQPQERFLVTLEYPKDFPYRAPALWVLEPPLAAGAPHVYADGSVCIHQTTWDAHRGTAASCVPLLSAWLLAYVVWLQTGERY